MEKSKSNKKGILLGIIILGFFLMGSYFVWASYSNDYYYFPDSFGSNDDIHLSITASGPNNSLDYYPGGYGVFIKPNENNRRKLTKFEIFNPAVDDAQIYNSDQACDENGEPSFCVTMTYVFEWTNESGKKIKSKVLAHKYAGQTGFIDVLPEVLDKAKFVSDPEEIVFPDGNKEMVIKQGLDELLIIKTYFGDDEYLEGMSFYSDISKKFALRTLKTESSYLGIAHSDRDLWCDVNEYGSYTTDAFGKCMDVDGKVSPENMKFLNFATVHVKGNTSGIIKYQTWVEPNQDTIKVVTLDMDNVAYDSTSRPELVSYIDFKVKRGDGEGGTMYVDKNGNEGNVPIHRISLQPGEYTDHYKTIPGVDTSVTEHSVGPSGSFLCNKGTIGTPGFIECYNAQSPEFKGITQHQINIPPIDEYQVIEITINNASTYVGNAFAIAGNIDMFGNDVPLEDLLAMLGGGASVSGHTSVEVDNKVGNGENGYDDDGKETKISYLHTYKTEICNNTTESVNNVLVTPYLPLKSTIVGDDVVESSLFLNGSNLDETIDEDKRLPISVFDSQINFGTLASGDCKFLTYQVTVDSSVNQGDILKVKNEFSYNGGENKYTNEVENPVLALTYDADIVLDSDPLPGTDVYLKDYITYIFDVENTGLTDIGSGSVICGRYDDTTETECKVGDVCGATYEFDSFEVGEQLTVTYAVEVKDGQAPGTLIEEQCHLDYDSGGGNVTRKDSNIVNHTIIDQSTFVNGGLFSLELYSRPKLLNTPDGDPRPDGLDQSPIKYTYKYTGSGHDYMYPDMSIHGTMEGLREGSGGRNGYGMCIESTWENTINSVSYNIYSTSTSNKTSLNLSSNNIDFSLDTTLPNAVPKTTLYKGTLYPTHYVPGSEANSRFKNGGTKILPLTATEHRALVNGTDGRIEADITGSTYIDTWKYLPVSTGRCSYKRPCTSDGGCDSDSLWSTKSYTTYAWKMIDRAEVQFDASAYRFVTVGGSSAWLKTSNGHVHTNDQLTEEGTSANKYDLGEAGYTNVTSAPKLYAPVGSFHGDYIVSSNSSTTNLKSEEGWYIYNKDIVRGHGYVYDRLVNARDFYTDLLEKQKFGEVITRTNTTESRLDMELNKVYHYTGDLTLERAGGNVIIAGRKATVVVEGDLYVNSNVKYSIEEKDTIKELPYLGLIVKGSVYIDGAVTETTGSRHVDGMTHTGNSVQTLHHLGSWTGNSFDFQRKAPEFYERDVNEPSEWIYFDDRVYVTPPPGFATLDEGVWSYKNNINQFTGEEVEW